MANKKELDKYTLDLLVKTIDKVIGRQYTLKQSKTILNQIKRLEESLDVKLDTESTQSSDDSSSDLTKNLCEALGWKENKVYTINDKEYQIVDDCLYVYQDPLSMWSKAKLQLDDFRNFEKAEKLYCFHIEDLGSYGYLSVSDFKSEYEQLFYDCRKQVFGIKINFTEKECEYLKNKYESLSVCEMIHVGYQY